MQRNIDILPNTQGYYMWIQSLRPGDEVAYKKNNYWGRQGKTLQTVVENDVKNSIVILSDGVKINSKTGRQTYSKSCYNDSSVHILPVTDELRYDLKYQEVRERFKKANDEKLTISEMEQAIKFVNKLLVKRKSHHPLIEGG